MGNHHFTRLKISASSLIEQFILLERVMIRGRKGRRKLSQSQLEAYGELIPAESYAPEELEELRATRFIDTSRPKPDLRAQ